MYMYKLYMYTPGLLSSHSTPHNQGNECAYLCVDGAGEEEDVEEGGVCEVTQARDARQRDGLEPTGGATRRGGESAYDRE